MNITEIDYYNTWQESLRKRFCTLSARYVETPFKVRHTKTELEEELDYVERLMLDYPPLVRTPNDGWTRYRKGLVEHTPRAPKLELKALTLEEAGIKVIPVREWPDLIDDPDRTPLDEYVEHILDQRSVGSCAAEGAGGSVMCRRNADGQKPVKLNPYFAYHTTSGGYDGGSTLPDNIAFFQKYGCATEDAWSRSNGWRKEPSNQAKQNGLRY